MAEIDSSRGKFFCQATAIKQSYDEPTVSMSGWEIRKLPNPEALSPKYKANGCGAVLTRERPDRIVSSLKDNLYRTQTLNLWMMRTCGVCTV